MEENKEPLMVPSENAITEIISINVICRLCANQNDKLIGIFSENGLSNDLASKMNLYLPIKVCEADELPLQCCWQCASTVLAWHDLFLTSLEADRRLRSYQFVSERQLKSVESFVETETHQQQEEHVHYEEEYHQELDHFPNTDPALTHAEIPNNINAEPQEEQENPTETNANISEYLQAVDLPSKTCRLCEQPFTNKTELKNHMFSSHNLKQPKFRRKKTEIDALFACPECRKRFTRKFDMQKHVQNKHPDKTGTIKPSVKSKNVEILKKCKALSENPSYYTCDVCNSKFDRSSSLMRHRSAHFNEKPYCCHICGAKFQMSAHLTRHIEQLHYDKKRFSCTYCDLLFKSKPSRDEHLNIHTQARPFMCDVCGKAFKQKASLFVHKKFHRDVFPFVCNVCGKKYRRKGELKVHQWIHSGERPYDCDICKKSFRLGQDLKRHYRTHATYTCGECNLSFDQLKSFKAHKKLHDNRKH